MNAIETRLDAYHWPVVDIGRDSDLNTTATSDVLIVEEKLKVDRKKFEALLDGNEPELGNAETFFANIMSEFESVAITWPQKLKSGTKSKKDPHVKITGLPFMVKAARVKILDFLDPRRDRVTLKMDVDWTAHSHIIGKAGGSIQTVMDSTGCHVHFPDANRTNANEKSNQVSIAGTATGVSQARIAIRDLLPIVISLDLLLRSGTRSTFLDRLNRVIQFVERLTNTQITLRFSASTLMAPDSTLITVFMRGVYGNCNLLKIGIDFLLKFMNEFVLEDDLIYQLNTEISGQHHLFVMGREQSNLKSIMQMTGAIITFPEPINKGIANKDIFARLALLPSAEPLEPRKTTVNIKGANVETVLMAFQMIELHLPLSLTFDLKEGQEVNTSNIEFLSNKWNVNISVKPKPKQNTKTIWIKAAEKDEWKLFEARRHLIREPEPEPKPEPKTKTTPLTSIWVPNEFDFLKLNDIQKSGSNAMTCIGNGIQFNRAPGAERHSRKRLILEEVI